MKSFLLEMSVISKNLSDPFSSHRLHGDAIRQTVAFVRTRLVETHSSKKRVPALRDDPDFRIGKKTAHCRRSPATLPWIRGKERHEFSQDLVGGENQHIGKDGVKCNGILLTGVARVG